VVVPDGDTSPSTPERAAVVIVATVDDATLASLSEALRVSPDNRPLLLTLLRAYLDLDRVSEAAALLGDRRPEGFPKDDERALISEVLLAAGQAERALGFAAGEAPALLMLRATARVHVTCDGRSLWSRDTRSQPSSIVSWGWVSATLLRWA